MTSYPFSRWRPRRRDTTSGLISVDVTTSRPCATLYAPSVLDQNWRWSGPRKHQTKFGTPYVLNYFLQPLKLCTTSNVVHKLGLGLVQQKTTFKTKIGGRLGQGNIQKNWDPLIISATVEASNFKFDCNLGLGLAYQKTTFRTKIGGDLGQGSIQTKFGTPYLFLHPTEKLVHNRFTLPNTSFRTKLGRV